VRQEYAIPICTTPRKAIAPQSAAVPVGSGSAHGSETAHASTFPKSVACSARLPDAASASARPSHRMPSTVSAHPRPLATASTLPSNGSVAVVVEGSVPRKKSVSPAASAPRNARSRLLILSPRSHGDSSST